MLLFPRSDPEGLLGWVAWVLGRCDFQGSSYIISKDSLVYEDVWE